jgi:hypothetical protein
VHLCLNIAHTQADKERIKAEVVENEASADPMAGMDFFGIA